MNHGSSCRDLRAWRWQSSRNRRFRASLSKTRRSVFARNRAPFNRTPREPASWMMKAPTSYRRRDRSPKAKDCRRSVICESRRNRSRALARDSRALRIRLLVDDKGNASANVRCESGAKRSSVFRAARRGGPVCPRPDDDGTAPPLRVAPSLGGRRRTWPTTRKAYQPAAHGMQNTNACAPPMCLGGSLRLKEPLVVPAAWTVRRSGGAASLGFSANIKRKRNAITKSSRSSLGSRCQRNGSGAFRARSASAAANGNRSPRLVAEVQSTT